MKKLPTANVIEVDNEGLIAFLGKTICVISLNYIYTGKLVGVNDSCIQLENPQIVYETGEWSATNWKDAQNLPSPWYLQTSTIESFGPGK